MVQDAALAMYDAEIAFIRSSIRSRRQVEGCIEKCQRQVAAAPRLEPTLKVATKFATTLARAVNDNTKDLKDAALNIKQFTEDYERTHPGVPAPSFVEEGPSLRDTAEELIETLSTFQEKFSSLTAVLSRHHEGAREALQSGPVIVEQLQESQREIKDSIRASYEVLHPIHRLPVELIKDIFLRLVHSEFEEAKNTLSTRYRLPFLTAPITLSMVCSQWKAVIDASPELWQFVTLVDSGNPFPFKKSETHRCISVLARGIRLPNLGELAQRCNIRELIVECRRITALQEALGSLPTLTRLLICYTGPKNPSIRITVPSDLSCLRTLACYRVFPDIPDYLLLSLQTLALAKFDHYQDSSTSFWQFLSRAPKLRKLIVLETEVTGDPVTSHKWIESITTNRPFRAAAIISSFPRLSSFITHNGTSIEAMIVDTQFADVMYDIQISLLTQLLEWLL